MTSYRAKASNFELIPNEVLLEVFEYLSSSDIFQAFYYLNNRYDRFLVSLHLHLDLLDLSKKIFDYHNYFLIPLVSHRIVALRCEDTFDRLTYQIHLPNFIALKYLTISNLCKETLLAIIPQLKSLEKLVYLKLQTRMECNIREEVVFEGRWPLLETCILRLTQQISFESDHCYAQLRSLTIDRCRIEGVGMFVCRYAPQLQQLTVTLIDGKVPAATDDVHHLKSLAIYTSDVPFHRLTKSVLPFFPSLQRLSISAVGIDYTDGKQWETYLSSTCPQLIHFRLRVSFADDVLATWDERIPLLHPFSTPYFRSRNWSFALIDCPSVRSVELFSIPMIKDKKHHDLYTSRIEIILDDGDPFQSITELSLHLTQPSENLPRANVRFPKVENLKLISHFQEHQPFPKDLLVGISRLVKLTHVTSIEFIEGNFPTCSLVLLEYTSNLRSLSVSLKNLIKMTKMLQDPTICPCLTKRVKHLTITSIASTKDLLLYERLPIVFMHLDSLSSSLDNQNDLYILITLLLTKMAQTLKTMEINIGPRYYNRSNLDQFMSWLVDYMHQRDLFHVDVKLSDRRLSFAL